MWIGTLLGAVTIVVLHFIPYRLRNELYGSLLVGIAGIYVGFAINDGRPSAVWIEGLAAIVFLVFTMTGRHLSVYWIGIGYMLHGLWDYAHDTILVDTQVTSGYPSFCGIYDVIIGVYIVAAVFMKNRAATYRRSE
ncbi:DUF6010 family protein [Paenibacillus kobensis]|uniref:DUF6010 family protein n=1 Tax=Paenibacillus kobensis TaxID=59841 RepID=UPI000FDA70C7|nr:DUF6010 family protein [Paenibacillus kobensis]